MEARRIESEYEDDEFFNARDIGISYSFNKLCNISNVIMNFSFKLKIIVSKFRKACE